MHFKGHDANISIYDGNKFSYIALERLFNEKRYSVVEKHSKWEISTSFYSNFLKDLLKSFNIPKEEILAIAVSSSALQEKAEGDKWNRVNYYNDLCNNVYYLDHHYAHHLSNFTQKNSWVLDGSGNQLSYSTVLKNDEIQERLYQGKDGYSLGFHLSHLSNILVGDSMNAGHVMGLEALGNTNIDYFNKYKDYSLQKSFEYFNTHNYDLYDLQNYLEINEKENNQKFFDYVKTIHEIVKVNHLAYVKKFFNKEDDFLFTGGVSQSIILNTELRKYFKNIEITPHGYDGGISLGLLYFLINQYNYDLPKIANFPFIQADEHPSFPSKQTILKAAEQLAKGKIVLWYQGSGEIGPRALGNRSILANPLIKNMKEQVNNKVKKRAWYRPYGASVLIEDYKEYFDLEWESPYMLYQANVKDKENLNSITHFDGTCRIQTVGQNHQIFYELLKEFKKLTGVSVLLNTSFNLPGSPIVGNINLAKETYNNSNADVLVVGDDFYCK